MDPEREARAGGRAMGTTVTVVVAAPDAGALTPTLRRIDELERRWSRFIDDSEISVLNRADGAPVIVSPETFAVVHAAVEGAVATEGRFDPTVHDSLISLGYDRSFADLEPVAASFTAAPGVSGIELDADLSAIRLPRGVRLDLGGIGKGAAADLVAEAAMLDGVAGIAVSIGGDVRVCGDSPSGQGWRFSHDGEDLPFGSLRDAGVCTSTTRRRRWTTSGGVVHHLVEPKTGEPTRGPIESVTVAGATAQQAEVLTKAAMVAGRQAPELLASFGVGAHIRWADAA